MSDPFSTEQEAFWAGRFGDEYLARNAGGDLIAARKALWTAALALLSYMLTHDVLADAIGFNAALSAFVVFAR